MDRFRRQLRIRRLEDRTAPATFTVQNLNDSGADSLRQCVLNANSAPGADTIQFKAGLAGTIFLMSGEIPITGNQALTITGPGPATLSVSGNNASNIFNMINATAGAAISFSGLTLRDAKGTSVAGGAIAGDDQKLTLANCVFNLNKAGRGGAVAMTAGGTFKATDCDFTANSVTGHGGALYLVQGGVTLTRCSLSGNDGGLSGGGGLITGDLLMDSCTVSGNSVQNVGGGLSLGTVSPSVVTIVNSTISDNTADFEGGGIFCETSLKLQNSTVTENSAIHGGGIYQSDDTNVIVLESTIISGNSSTSMSPPSPNISSKGTVSVSFSAVGSSSGFTMTNLGGNVFLPHANLLLGPLANNGGPTLTHALALTSPCVNKGNNALGLTTDQRGTGFARVVGAAADIGAFELATLIVDNLNDSGPGSLRQAVLDANTTAGKNTIEFVPGLTGTITLTSGEIAINDGVTINGPGALSLAVSGNKASRIFNISGLPAPATGAFVSINGLTLTNGVIAGKGKDGGAILGVDESLFVNNCVFAANSANVGGAITIGPGGNLTATNSSFIGNSASNSAGAIFVGGTSGSVSMTACTVSGNSAPTAGGIYAQSALFILNSTVSANTAVGGLGGGISTGTLAGVTRIIRNSTISGNSAGFGGGIAFVNSTGELVIHNSTVTANTASGNGGGVGRLNGTGAITIESSIVSGNTCAASPDISSPGSVTLKTSAIGSGTGFTKTDLGGNLAFGTNLLLGPLQNNGGLTLTHLLAPGSPCLNVGSNPASLTTDQRGPGFPRVFNGQAEIGATEFGFSAATVVTNINDAGLGSLRDAIVSANNLAGANTVTFDPTVFATPQVISLSTGELAITDSVTIISPPAKLTLDAGAKSRHFNIDGAGTLEVSISGLNLINGNSGTGDGGSVRIADEVVVLSNMSFTGNKAEGGDGGAITIAATTFDVTMLDCTISGNSAGGEGGGVNVDNTNGKLTVLRCIVSGNTAGSDGGGIYFFAGGTLVMDDCTVSGNTANKLTAGFGGGGIYLFNTTATIRNCTFSGNSASNGGGIGIFNGGATVIQNSTIAFNTAKNVGGGITRPNNTAVTIESTIVSNNTAPTGPDVNGTIGTINSSLVSNSTGLAFTTGTGNLLDVDGKLGPLADNGGPTMTHALLAGSPAINAGSNPAALANDQRGVGFARSVGVTDIGAFELPLVPAKVANVQINDKSSQRSRVTSVTVVFDTAITFNGAAANAFSLVRQSGGAIGGFSSIAVNVSGHTEVTLSDFTGAETQFGSLADGRYTLTVFASQISNLDGDGDGTPGDNFVLTGDPAVAPKLYRLFGDADGDGDVDTTDFGAFRTVFGGTSTIFDFDNDGDVDTSDFGAFRARFGASV